ncbi:MAG: AAA family ATPase [Burkholderiaceae bacterium]
MDRYGRLNKITVSGFKSIQKIDLELGPLNILIGANGVGKSNFIFIFKFINQLLLKNLEFYVPQQLGTDKFLFFGSKRTPKLSINLDFTPNAYTCDLVPDSSGRRFVFEREFCTLHGDKTNYYKGGTKNYQLAKPGDSESGLPDVIEQSPNTAPGFVTKYLKDWKVYHFHDTSASALVKKPHKISDCSSLATDASNLAAFLKSIQSKPDYQNIKDTIRRVAPFFLDFFLEPEDDPEFIRLRWRHRGSETIFDASDLSDGTLRFICLTTLLLQPNLPTIILLDEPELGLHPYALTILAGMIRNASNQTQIIASTQSVTLANQFSWEDLIVIDRIDESSVFRKLKKEEIEAWIVDYEYGVGDLWEKNIIGGNPL